jgi:hypothetical protein
LRTRVAYPSATGVLLCASFSVCGAADAQTPADPYSYARTSSFAYLYNECLHSKMCGTNSTSYVRVTGNVAADPAGYVNPLTTAVHLEIRLVNGYGETVLEGKFLGGMLVSAFNDAAPDRAWLNRGIVVFDTVVPVPAGMSAADFAGRIMESALAYQAVPYSLPNVATMQMAPGKYNSNSWVAGVLQAAGANAAVVPYQARRQGSRFGFSTPGFSNPVPIPGN